MHSNSFGSRHIIQITSYFYRGTPTLIKSRMITLRFRVTSTSFWPLARMLVLIRWWRRQRRFASESWCRSYYNRNRRTAVFRPDDSWMFVNNRVLSGAWHVTAWYRDYLTVAEASNNISPVVLKILMQGNLCDVPSLRRHWIHQTQIQSSLGMVPADSSRIIKTSL